MLGLSQEVASLGLALSPDVHPVGHQGPHQHHQGPGHDHLLQMPPHIGGDLVQGLGELVALDGLLDAMVAVMPAKVSPK